MGLELSRKEKRAPRVHGVRFKWFLGHLRRQVPLEQSNPFWQMSRPASHSSPSCRAQRVPTTGQQPHGSRINSTPSGHFSLHGCWHLSGHLLAAVSWESGRLCKHITDFIDYELYYSEAKEAARMGYRDERQWKKDGSDAHGDIGDQGRVPGAFYIWHCMCVGRVIAPLSRINPYMFDDCR